MIHVLCASAREGNAVLVFLLSYVFLQINVPSICSLNTPQLILSTPSGRSLCSECKDQKGNTLLHIAARAGMLEVIKCMLEWKQEIKCNVENDEGKTPMYLATEKGHHE